MKKLALLALLLGTAALAPACGAVSNGGDPTPTPSPSPTGGQIANIQQGNVTVGSEVTLTGVIVTAIDPATGGVDFWAQDAGGGEFSGIYFFDSNGVSPAQIAVGDEITVTGTYSEYQGMSTDTVSEIAPSAITITNSGVAVTADVIPSTDFATELNGAGAETWEGCLIEIGGTVNVVAPAVQFGTFEVTNGTATIKVDDVIYTDSEVGRATNEPLTHLAGIYHYAFDAFALLPRNAQDIVGVISAPVLKTIVMVQDTANAAHPAVGSYVIIDDAVVTASYVSANKRSIFVQQGAAGVNNGLFVFNQNATVANVTTGYVVDITAKYDEFNGLSELVLNTAGQAPASVTVVTGVAVDVTPLSLTLATLMANPEPYEGVLITVTGPALSCTASTIGFGEYTVWSGGAYPRMVVDDLVYPASEVGMVVGRTFTTLTGVFTYTFGAYKLEPRSSKDVVTP